VLLQGEISGCGKKTSQDIPFGKKMGHTGLDCCHANGFKIQYLLITGSGQMHSSHALSLDLTLLAKKRAEWGTVTHKACAPAAHILSFLIIYQLNSVVKGRLHGLEDFSPACDTQGGAFTF